MADDAGTKADEAGIAEKVVDDARSEADGTRETARWIASAFAGIPALGILAALVRAPGDKGFDWLPLLIGILLSGAGAVVGILAFARVFAPVPLNENDLKDDLDLTGIPGHPFTTYGPLADELASLRSVLGPKLVETEDAQADADRAKAIAAEFEAQAAVAEKASADSPNDQELKNRAFAARDAANARKVAAAELTALASYREGSTTSLRKQIDAREAIRGDALRLLAADAVSSNFRQARTAVIAASVAVALGIFALAMAPKTTASPSAPTLVTLHLNDAGRDVLNCNAETVPALRIGGDDATPEVITLPIGECVSVTLKFPTVDPAKLGRVEKSELVTAPPGASD